MTYSVITLGCKVNQYESQQMAEQLENIGFTPAQNGDAADIYIINSCAVTATAEQKSRQAVHRAKRQNPNAVVCLSGCISQAFADKYSGFTDADIIIGNSNREILPDLIQKFIEQREPIRAVLPHTPTSGLCGSVANLGARTRAYIWHIGLAIQALTCGSKEEAKEIINTIISTDADCELMHEGFDADDPHNFTRPWFAWANSLFAELVYHAYFED